MSEKPSKLIQQYVSKQGLQEIKRWIAKYPADQRQSAVMQTLMILQDEHGYLKPEMLAAVAEYLEMPSIAVYEVATFYSMYELKPVGKHVLNVCNSISCKLCGADETIDLIGKKLGIKAGETTADGLFTLKAVPCLGACAAAPLIELHKEYHEKVTPEKIDALIHECRTGACHDH